jgi:ATP-dependent DNA helicase RecQ
VKDLLSRGESFDLALTDYSNRHDMRPIVLKTGLTYLELLGVLRQGTPYYAGFELKTLVPANDIYGRFDPSRADFLRRVFAAGKQGRTWLSFDPQDVAKKLGEDRQRIVRALEYLQQQGLAELRVSDVRQRYTRLRSSEDAGALVAELMTRFQKREQQEIARLKMVLELVTHEGCQVNALVGYFGESRSGPCGHCTFCLSGRQILPPEQQQPPITSTLDLRAWRELKEAQPEALGHPRQAARFLCGLTSPALSRARLSRNALFGALEDRPFAEVLAWCEEA